MKLRKLLRRLQNFGFKLPNKVASLLFLRIPQQFGIINCSEKVLEVHIEIRPHRYLLKPNDQMNVKAVLEGAPLDINYRDGSLQIYAGYDIDPEVRINGVLVEPDWETPNPDNPETAISN